MIFPNFEINKRKWMCFETVEEYLEGSRFRFPRVYDGQKDGYKFFPIGGG